MTASALAGRASVAPQTIGNWREGKNEPNLSQLRRVSTALGVSIASLVGEEAEKRSRPREPDRELVERLAELDLLSTLRTLERATPQLLDLLATAERRAAARKARLRPR
jgi:transcriptional regulator with XRE-family HTH domain